jgi:Cu-Zn family superoxide dismutase
VAANADALHEVWLDFTTNAEGRGRSQTVVPFEVLSGSRSVVIHQNAHTAVGGTAGQRLACLDIAV